MAVPASLTATTFAPDFVQEPGCRRADLAEALDGHCRAFQRDVVRAGDFLDDVQEAATGRLGAAERAADGDGLAGDDAGDQCGRGAWRSCP